MVSKFEYMSDSEIIENYKRLKDGFPGWTRRWRERPNEYHHTTIVSRLFNILNR
jgi:hypothetical protein